MPNIDHQLSITATATAAAAAAVQVLTELAAKGNFDNVKAALDKLLPRLLG